jgi:hypothetical protein
MALITRYGGFWGFVPVTSGRIFFVAPSASYTVEGRAYSASDSNDGLSPERALVTVDQAVSLATDAVGDVIVLLPGAHTTTASLAVSKANLTFTGFPGNPVRPPTSITCGASDEIMNVTAADVTVQHLRLIPITQKAAIDFTSAANRLRVHNCSIDLATAAAHTSTQGIAATTAAQSPSHVLIENNYVECDGAQGAAFAMGDSKDYIVRGNTVVQSAGTWAAAASGLGTTSQRGLWANNTFLTQAGATQTAGIKGADVGSASAVQAVGNLFAGPIGAVAKPFEDWGSADLEIVENYQSSGASGSLIITAIT